jgi:hypothetical protein
MRAKRPVPVVTAGEMVARGGFANFVRAVRFAARYSEACDAVGHLCTLKEYQEARGMSRAMAFREQQAWRRCVGPDLEVLDVVSAAALDKKGWTEDERSDAIARFLTDG